MDYKENLFSLAFPPQILPSPSLSQFSEVHLYGIDLMVKLVEIAPKNVLFPHSFVCSFGIIVS